MAPVGWNLRRGRPSPWYVPAALEARSEPRAKPGLARARPGRTGALVTATALLAGALAACGSGDRQDASDPEGEFPVEVVRAEFPTDQKLAKRSDLELVVRNAGSRPIPNLAVTFGRNSEKGRIDTFYKRVDDPSLADPRRPIFAVNGRPREIGGLPEAQEQVPQGSQTAYVDTYAAGELPPGRTRVLKWNVTAVDPGPFRLVWTVSASLSGKSKAVLPNGQPPVGSFTGTIREDPPRSRVSQRDGKTVLRDYPKE